MSCEVRTGMWWHDPAQLAEEYQAHGTFGGIAATHGGHETTYSKWAAQLGVEKNPVQLLTAGSGVEVDVNDRDDIDRELRERGLDPDQWVVVRLVVNTWEGFVKTDGADGDGGASGGKPVAEKVPLRQLKATLRPRLDAILSPAPDVRPIPAPKPPDPAAARLVVFVGDEQAPYHDQHLHQLFLRWLAHNKPAQGVHLGDLMDFPTISRHRRNPGWDATPQECINAGYRILRAYREASTDTTWDALPGNHEERLRDYQLARAADLFGITPADTDIPAHDIRTLLHLDQLGVRWHGAQNDYEHQQIDVSHELVARHGWITGSNSAAKTVDRLGISCVVGHTHRQIITYVTEERRRERLTLLCIEAGCMCKVDGGLGYVVNPSWQNGFATAQVWPDGTATVDHATYRDGVLRWRDQEYRAADTLKAAA